MLLILLQLLVPLAHSQEPQHPLALIYRGPGACDDSSVSCSDAAAIIARRAGFDYQFVSNDAFDRRAAQNEMKALFSKASLWIQPGGYSTTAYKSMSHRLRKEIKRFVFNGGGYVGFCAGAFMAVHWLKIFPSQATLFNYEPSKQNVDYAFIPVTWAGEERSLYFEGGPFLSHEATGVDVVARYKDGTIAAARTLYGKGRVFIVGAHPEAPSLWSEEDGLSDPDGEDHDLATQMLQWVVNH